MNTEMNYLKIQQDVLKNWFEAITKDRVVGYKYCEDENSSYVTDNKAVFVIPKRLWLLNSNEDDLFEKIQNNNIKKVLKEPSDLREYNKTNRIEIISNGYSKPITAIVLESKDSDSLIAYLNKKYLDVFSNDCVVKGTRPDYPFFVYETRDGELALAGVVMPVISN